jgi:hypothetical protein
MLPSVTPGGRRQGGSGEQRHRLRRLLAGGAPLFLPVRATRSSGNDGNGIFAANRPDGQIRNSVGEDRW